MSLHRRPAHGEAPPQQWRAGELRGRRQSHRRSNRLLPVALGVGLLGIGAMAGPSVIGNGWSGGQRDERITYAALPKDAPDEGLVYDGLESAAAGSRCAGSYQLDATLCTNGPDSAPAGLLVRHDVAPVTPKTPEPVAPTRESAKVPPDAEIVRDEGGSARSPNAPALIPDAAPGNADFIMGPQNVACEGDGRGGKRVQVLYLHTFGTPSRYSDFLGSISTWSAGVDKIFDASAAETGGSRHIRFATTPQCKVDVAEVQLPQGALTSFQRNISALQTLGYNRTDRKYLIFADANVYCGIGTYIADKRPGLGNRNNGGPSYGRIDAGCWSSVMAAHETTQMLGAALRDSPNSSGGGSCTDDYDLLCRRDRSGKAAGTVCPQSHQSRLDCNHDNYFSTNPKPGSYLAQNWNVAQSEFLLRGDGGDDIPDVPGSPVPTISATAPPKPAPRVPPKAGATGGAGTPAGPDVNATVAPNSSADNGGEAAPPAESADPSGQRAAAQRVQAALEVRDATSTAVRLRWSAASAKASYEVAVDGVPIATTVATRAQLIGLRPDSTYQVTIRVAKANYRAKATAHTSPAARPAQNSWFVLTNSLTGGAADLYAARTANGTPLTLGESDGDAQEQWRLVPAGDGAFTLQSRATGKCAGPQGGNPVVGVPLVEGECTPSLAQHWQLQLSANGFSLKTADADLVVGVGNQRLGPHRVLTLQNGGGMRHQSWTAVPG